MNRGIFLLFFFVTAVFLSFTTSCAGNTNRWKIGKNTANTSAFGLQAGQSAINSGNFKNFDFKARITHSEGAKAILWFHSDSTLSKGYSILIGNPANDHRRSGSLASVRNLYKPVSSLFDLEVKVEGKRIVVRVERGTLNVTGADITSLPDNLPNYPDGRQPPDERDDAMIRLQQKNFPVIDYHVHWPGNVNMNAAIEKSLADGYEYGIASHEISDDRVKVLFTNDFTFPQLFYAMQGEGREWPKILTKESRDMFDYDLFPKDAKERYSVKRKNEEDIATSNLVQPKKIDISSFTIEGSNGVKIPITDKDGMITRGKGISQELLAGYQEIVNKYLEKTSKGKRGETYKFYWKSDSLSDKDWTRLYAVYVQMTESQQKDQMIWEPSPSLNIALSPPQRLYDSWMEDKKCQILIDGEKVDNSALNSCKPTDFVYYFTSSLRRSGGKIGDYRVDLRTETGHKKFSKQLYEQPVLIDKLLEIEPKIIF